jgi:hypothetical protein
MKHTVYTAALLVIVLSLYTARSAQAIGSESGDEAKAIEEVLRIDQERADAMVKNDTDALGRILADDCTYVHPTGKSETKAEVLAGLKAHDRTYLSIERDEVKVKIFGTTAVVSGRNNLKAK